MRGSHNLDDREGAGPAGLDAGFKLGGAPPSAPTQGTPPPTSPGSAARDETKEFIVRVLGDTEGGHFARQRNLLEPGDVGSGLAAAAAIGDDRLQRRLIPPRRASRFTR